MTIARNLRHAMARRKRAGSRGWRRAIARLAVVGLALLALFVLGTACADDVPSMSDGVSSEQALEAASRRLEAAVAALEDANAADRGMEQAVARYRLDADMLYLAALLSEIAIELEIAERLLDPGIDRLPRPWPLTDESATGLGTTQRRLEILRVQLLRQRDRLMLPPTSDAQLDLAVSLTELSEQLSAPLSALSALRIAHLQADSAAPAFPALDRLRLILQRATAAAEALAIQPVR